MGTYQKRLIYILVLAALGIYIALPNSPGFHFGSIQRDFPFKLGLDLEGGVRALLEADLPEDVEISPESMQTARTIIENRANGFLGVGEATVQIVGDRRLVVELPGATDPQAALSVLGETGQLEFVNFSGLSFEQAEMLIGSKIYTDYPTRPQDVPEGVPVFNTIMTGDLLENAGPSQGQLGQYEVVFELNNTGAEVFGTYTTDNVGTLLAIVLDKEVISAPRINSPIVGGVGTITGDFTLEEAQDLAIKLRYGSLPITLKVVESRTVGPSLGQDSLQKSLVAGLVGLGLVALFMLGYYRLPGILATFGLLLYAVLTLALFKIIPVTLTLPGIAGFVLSIGVAVDANILIFERLKEELKAGRSLSGAIEEAWSRAWPSIRDSNLSTLITCMVLFWFGNNFGASIVKGFSVTLALGVGVSMFTAIFVTRTLLHQVEGFLKIEKHAAWFGIKPGDIAVRKSRLSRA